MGWMLWGPACGEAVDEGALRCRQEQVLGSAPGVNRGRQGPHGQCGYSHMGFSCPTSSSLVHFAHSFLSVLMEQRMGPQGLPQSSMAGTLR